MKRIGVDNSSRRTPSSNLDIIHKNKNADAQILYAEDSNLPSIHGGSQLHNVNNNGRGSAAHQGLYQYGGGQQRQGGSRFVKPPLH